MDGVVVRGETESGIDQGKEREVYFVDTDVLFPLLLSFSSALPFLCDTLSSPPFQRTERTRRESQSAGQNRGLKRKSNKT